MPRGEHRRATAVLMLPTQRVFSNLRLQGRPAKEVEQRHHLVLCTGLLTVGRLAKGFLCVVAASSTWPGLTHHALRQD